MTQKKGGQINMEILSLASKTDIRNRWQGLRERVDSKTMKSRTVDGRTGDGKTVDGRTETVEREIERL